MKALRVITLILFATGLTTAQVLKDSWALGFGISVPRYVGVDVVGAVSTVGLHSSLQANLSEHSNFRLSGRALMLKINRDNKFQNITVSIGLDYLYHMTPCEIVNPYFGLGTHALIYNLSGNKGGSKNATYYDYQASLTFGVQWGLFDQFLGENWKVKTELGVHTTATDDFDGKKGPAGGLFGGGLDNYFNFDLGVLWFFDSGKRAKYCDIYDGVRASEKAEAVTVDYDKIEDIVKKYASSPADVDYKKIDEMIRSHKSNGVILQAPSNTTAVESYKGNGNWVLLGINFDPGRATFRPESYPLLINAAQILLTNAEVRVEIQGHTDNVGSDDANNRLSLERAEAVKRFLVSKGIDEARLTTIGLGASQPISDNATAEGKAFNRRIEFKIIQ